MRKVIIFLYSRRGFKLDPVLPEGYKLIKIPGFGKYNRVRNYIYLIKLLSKINYKENKVTILVDSAWLSLYLSCFLKKIFPIKVICRIRGNVYEEYKKKHIDKWIFESFCSKKVDLFICVSKFLKKIYITNGIPSQKLEVLHVPIEDAFLSTTLDPNPEYFTFITNFHFFSKVELLPEGIIKLCEIIKKNKWGYRILILGDGNFRKEVEEKIYKVSTNKNLVIFKGYVPKNEVLEILKQTKIFFHFSNLDAFPTVIQQALAVGIPVIANNLESIEEMIEHGKNGFIIKDFHELDKYVSLLIGNKEFYKNMALSAKKSCYRWDPVYLKQKMQKILDDFFENF